MNYLRGFSLNAVSTGLAFSLGFANQALLGRNLSPEDFGRLALWTTTVMLGGLLFGEWLNRGSTYVVGKERERTNVAHNPLVYVLGLGAFLDSVYFSSDAFA